jgi:hypothetical protein
MANFSVRIFGYSGLRQVPVKNPTQFTVDSVSLLDEPYLWSQVIAVTGVAAESAVQANDMATILRIEVPDDQAVRFEINPNGPGTATHRTAGNASPKLTGNDQFAWFQGATVSLIDASGLP